MLLVSVTVTRRQSGCARFCSNFIFNRKRNVVELQLRQELATKGALKYAVSVTHRQVQGNSNDVQFCQSNLTFVCCIGVLFMSFLRVRRDVVWDVGKS